MTEEQVEADIVAESPQLAEEDHTNSEEGGLEGAKRRTKDEENVKEFPQSADVEVNNDSEKKDEDPLKSESESESSDLFDDIGHTESTPTEQGGSFVDSTFDSDLFITVSHPKKHVETMETYISYRLTTKTTRSSFDDSEYEVYRRYQDFDWLRNKLESDHPTNLIPPLPSKFVVKSMMDRFSSSFIKTRCQALHNFMQRISSHPVLSCNESLKGFLTASAPELAAMRKQTGEGFMSRMSGSVKSLTMGGGTSMKLKERDERLCEEYERISEFGDKMATLIRIGERVHDEKRSAVDELREFAPTFAAWSGSEDVISPLLTSLSACIEACAKAAEINAKEQEVSFLPPLREYHLYVDVVKSLMRKRDMTQVNYERIVEEEVRKKEEKENLPRSDQTYSLGAMMGKNAADVKEQKERKLDQQIEEICKKREEAFDLMQVANTDLRADLERWSFDKTMDIARTLDDHANAQILYHQECIEAWESVLPQLREGNSGEQQVNEDAE